MKSAGRRRAGYDARMQSSLVDPTLTATNAQQKSKYAAHIADLYPKQTILRGILDAAGLAGPAAFPFESFSSEVFAIGRRFDGPAAVAAALALSRKYNRLGYADAVLCSILTAVHSLPLPTPAQVVLVSPANGAPAEPKAGTLTTP